MPNNSSSKPTVGYTEDVVLFGTKTAKSSYAKCDTGAKRTSVDTNVAQSVGLSTPVGHRTVRTSNGSEKRPIHTMKIMINDETHTVDVYVNDRSQMRYNILIGRDILNDYLVDVETKIN